MPQWFHDLKGLDITDGDLVLLNQQVSPCTRTLADPCAFSYPRHLASRLARLVWQLALQGSTYIPKVPAWLLLRRDSPACTLLRRLCASCNH